VLYVSTRGEAPTLGFADAMLAGLAPDGGLYVPAAWPRLDAGAIAPQVEGKFMSAFIRARKPASAARHL